MAKHNWVVGVKGPDGVRYIELSDDDVTEYFGVNNYASAAWLAGWMIQKHATDG